MRSLLAVAFFMALILIEMEVEAAGTGNHADDAKRFVWKEKTYQTLLLRNYFYNLLDTLTLVDSVVNGVTQTTTIITMERFVFLRTNYANRTFRTKLSLLSEFHENQKNIVNQIFRTKFSQSVEIFLSDVFYILQQNVDNEWKEF